jgi:3-isopropylmalate dehydratase small subunit
MEPFRSVTGVAAPLLVDDVNTDQIMPTAWLHVARPNFAEGLFGYMRRGADGGRDPDFVLERPQFRASRILVVGRNFGCGSSREHAAWGMLAFGIRCIVARSFADFFRDNCLRNGVLPVTLPDADMDALAARVVSVDGAAPFTVDLQAENIVAPDGSVTAFALPAQERTALLEGLDDIAQTLKHADAIAAWERRDARPYLQTPIADA